MGGGGVGADIFPIFCGLRVILVVWIKMSNQTKGSFRLDNINHFFLGLTCNFSTNKVYSNKNASSSQ